MATIKIKRGSGQPNLTGLTAYEPAWDTTFNRLFIHAGTTAMWIGSQVVDDTTLAGNCAYFIPSQRAVKTYVDSQVAGGAVSSLNGATGAVTIGGGTGISISTSTSARGITLFTSSIVPLTNKTNTFTASQIISGTSSTLLLTDTSTSDSITLDPALNKIVFQDGGTNFTTTLYVDTFTDHIVTLPQSATRLAGLATTTPFTAQQTFTAGISVAGGITLNGLSVLTSANGVTSVDGVTGAVDIIAGTGISITLPTGANKGITLANTGVVGITGTANQVTVSGTTGSVTLSLPSAITTPGTLTVTGALTASSNVTVSGNLTVNGTTTTVNSTSVTVQDPLIAIGGLTGNIPPVTGDVKDRGILFQHFATVGRTGFFGHDTSTGRFTYLPATTSVSGEVVTGTAGIAEFAGIYGPQGSLLLAGLCAGSVVSTINVNSGPVDGTIVYTSARNIFNSSSVFVQPTIELSSSDSGGAYSVIQSGAGISNKTFTLPNITGTGVVADAGGATSGWILRGAGATTVNSWINPQASGFTAYGAERSLFASLVGVKNSSSYPLVFAGGTSGYQQLYTDSSQDINWNPGTLTLTLGSGLGKLEGVVDGGAF
jgi:hypothetical protein